MRVRNTRHNSQTLNTKMPSLVTVLTTPSNHNTSLGVRTTVPLDITEGRENLSKFSSEYFDSTASYGPQPLSVGNLLASTSNAVYYEEKSSEFFEQAAEYFNSPLPFDASENGFFNGRFVPPPPRPPFLVDESVLSDGLTTCDLCSWAMPTKSTFIFEGTIEKASELGWPLTLIIVSVLSAILGAIIMITVVRCKRKKSSNNRNETHVQWWSRNKRSNNNNHLRRSNIYTAHPADSIRGLHGQQPQAPQQPPSSQQITLQPHESQLCQQHQVHNHSHFPHVHHHHHHHHHQQQQQQQHHHPHYYQHRDDQQLELHQEQQLPHPEHQLQHHSGGVTSIDTCNWPNITTLVVPS